MVRRRWAVVSLGALAVGTACGSEVVILGGSTGGSSDGGSSSVVSSSSVTSSSASMSSTGVGGAGGEMGGEVCASTSVETGVEKAPADIIFVIDNSGSMSQEIAAVEQNINVNFAAIVASAQIDYRVIMLTDHGLGSYDLCVGPPLSPTTNCSGPPGEVPGQFYHYDVNVQSSDSLCIILDTLTGVSNGGAEPDEWGNHPDGWLPLLRPNAIKFFIEITDDAPDCTFQGTHLKDSNVTPQYPEQGKQTAVNFDKLLLAKAPQQFGDVYKRRYKFYAITGVAQNVPPLVPYSSNHPLVTQKCPTAINTGTGYQWLSKGAGGYRFPVCLTQDYGPIFARIADDVLVSTALPCTIELPEPPLGEIADPSNVDVVFAPDPSAPPLSMQQVPGVADCQPGQAQFYVEGNAVELCPDACAQVSSNDVEDGEIFVDLHCE